MMTNLFPGDDAQLDGKLLSPDTIELTAEQMDRAIAASGQGSTEDAQWERYLRALAWQGMEEWLQKRAPQLVSQSVWKGTGDVPETLQVGDFRLQLLITDALDHREIGVPEAALRGRAAHFYVLVEVLEDLEQVTIGGYLRGDQVRQGTHADGFCWLAVDGFEASSDRLLLELQSLSPAAISLPVATAKETTAPTLGQRVVNAGLWLRDQLDPLAQELAWVLLPPPGLSPALRGGRSPVEQFNAVIANLSDQRGLQVPPQARAAYKEVAGDQDLYLYVVTWELEPWNHPSDWSLMAILSAPTGTLLPAQTDLQIWEGAEPLVEQRLEHTTDGGYLFAQVGGTPDEQFSIQVRLPGCDAVYFPPFSFIKAAEA